MGLPVTALSDDELIHYAGIDEDAQREMARRSIEYRGTYLSEVTDLKKEVEELRDQIEELEGESSAADDLQECIQRAYDLLKDFKTMDTGEAFEAIQSALDEISDFAR